MSCVPRLSYVGVTCQESVLLLFASPLFFLDFFRYKYVFPAPLRFLEEGLRGGRLSLPAPDRKGGVSQWETRTFAPLVAPLLAGGGARDDLCVF